MLPDAHSFRSSGASWKGTWLCQQQGQGGGAERGLLPSGAVHTRLFLKGIQGGGAGVGAVRRLEECP